MSDTGYFGESNQTFGQESSEGKAPFAFLLIGVGLVTIQTVLLFVLGRPNGDAAVFGWAGQWLLNLVVSLTPFALFVTRDLAIRSKVTYYQTSPATVKAVRIVYLGVSLAASLFYIYGIADELSRILNVVH